MLRKLLFPLVLIGAVYLAGCGDGSNALITDPLPEDDPLPEIIEPCRLTGLVFPTAISSDPDPMVEANDITIGWIGRLPEIDYVWGSASPASEGWPSPGQDTIWRAHVTNWADTLQQQVAYQWLLDGFVVDEGRIDLLPGGTTTLDFSWEWTFDRHQVSLLVDSDSGPNNRLSIYTDALSLGLYVEQRLYDYFHDNQRELGIGSNSFEGWAQRQIRFYNELFQRAIYEDTPQGVLDRIRIDKITVVPDGMLPLIPPPTDDGFDPPQAIPSLNDRSVDLQWGFPADLLDTGLFANRSQVIFSNQFFHSGFLQHELGHARYLIDTYGFDILDGDVAVDIRENGEPIAGTSYLQGTGNIVNGSPALYQTLERGLMHSQWRWMDRYSAMAMNQIASFRATMGNFNGSDNEGAFLNDLPRENRFKIKDRRGRLLRNANVQIFQSSPNDAVAADPYPKFFDDVPDLEFVSDDNGQVLLGTNPFSNTDPIAHQWKVFSNSVLIMRVEADGMVGYKILEVSSFNMEYWRGHTDLADHEVCVSLS